MWSFTKRLAKRQFDDRNNLDKNKESHTSNNVHFLLDIRNPDHQGDEPRQNILQHHVEAGLGCFKKNRVFLQFSKR